jgi:hypothetical protein
MAPARPLTQNLRGISFCPWIAGLIPADGKPVMKRYRRYLTVLAALLLISLVFLLSRSSPTVPTPNKLAVTFIGLTKNPTRTMGPPRIAVCGGATGLCALFLVTNMTSNEFLWFKTPFAEQKIAGEWKEISHELNGWRGIEGGLWSPSYGCLIAVGWPPGLPTNATWRLRVAYGREASGLRLYINHRLRREIFHGSKEENFVSSSEVVPN